MVTHRNKNKVILVANLTYIKNSEISSGFLYEEIFLNE